METSRLQMNYGFNWTNKKYNLRRIVNAFSRQHIPMFLIPLIRVLFTRTRFTLVILGMVLFLSETTILAQESYAVADIIRGSLVVVRDGQSLHFKVTDSPVAIEGGDLIRTGMKSTARLTLVNENRVTLGGNAILQVRHWRAGKTRGDLRMLFGKFRARTLGGKQRRPLNIRTTATIIGVRGSLGEGNTGPDFTTISNLEGTINLAGVEIPLGQSGFKLDDMLPGLSGLDLIPDFDPEISADKREMETPETLNTTDAKSVDLTAGVTFGDLEKIEEVRESEGDVVPEVRETEDTPEEAVEELAEDVEKDEEEAESEEIEKQAEDTERFPEESGMEQEGIESLVEDISEQVREVSETAATTKSGRVKIKIQVED